jgi:hypothetical protein
MSNDRDSRIEDKLDKVAESISEIKVTLGEQHVSLDYHIMRTTLLEEAVKPLQRQHTIINFCVKVITTVLGSALVVVIIKKLLS